MKIQGDSLNGSFISAKYDEAVLNISKSIMQMKAGDKFTGTVVDIKPDSVSLRLEDNTVLNAKSLVMTDLHIGEEADFVVKENSSGRVFVELAKGGFDERNSNIIKELLNNANMPFTKETRELVSMLLENKMPVDKETIENAAFFKFIAEKNIDLTQRAEQLPKTLEKVLFLLKEEMPSSEITVETLNRIIDGKIGLKSELTAAASQIFKLPDGEIKNKIFDLFDIKDSSISEKQFFVKVKEKLFVEIKDKDSLNNLSEKFDRIYKTAEKGSEIVSESSEFAALKQNFDNIKNDIDFMNHINNYKDYLQIPLNINNKEQQCELYVFKDSKKGGVGGKNASVLLSLNYAFLGQVDTFIEKADKNLSFQFRVENINPLNIIKDNIGRLSSALEEKGFRIASVTFKEIDEPFNVMKDKNSGTSLNKNINKRYSFDMRV